MYWRAIVRLSFNRDSGSALRNSIAEQLSKAGFINTKTGTWELNTENEITLLRAVRATTRRVQNPSKYTNAPNVRLDHLWIYIDRLEGNLPMRNEAPVSD